MRLFQGPLAPISCATRHNPEPCPMSVGCTLREVWEEVRDATITLLGGVTFADLAKRAGGPWVDPALDCARSEPCDGRVDSGPVDVATEYGLFIGGAPIDPFGL